MTGAEDTGRAGVGAGLVEASLRPGWVCACAGKGRRRCRFAESGACTRGRCLKPAGAGEEGRLLERRALGGATSEVKVEVVAVERLER